jgi:hypothetical protein
MTRSFVTAVSTLFVGLALSPAFLQGCKATGVGDPCTPEQEYNQEFNGFDEKEVNVESKSFQCQTRLCLVNHFRGRVTCPYGQTVGADATFSGAPFDDAKNATACTIPGGSEKITGRPGDTKTGAQVKSQCTDRTADDTVYCSCRCANIDGKTDDGANYCKCPDGFSCSQLVTSIGAGDTGLTGAYCVKDKTDYNATSCLNGCDPSSKATECKKR